MGDNLYPPEGRPPPRARARPPFKRLIVSADGTWLNSDDGSVSGELSIPSNVTRMARAIKSISSDGIPQICYYHYGVGSKGTVAARLIGGITGEGLELNVREGYSFLSNNYDPGDEVFLFGYSRGAFTARTIAGLIAAVGLLTKAGLQHLGEIYRDVRNRRNPSYRPQQRDVPFPRKPSANDPRYREELQRRGLAYLDVAVKVIGVWDTVGSLGAPRIGWLTSVGLQDRESSEMVFYDTKLSNVVENAFQALCLDDRRTAFAPAIWEKSEGNITTLRQVWFPGAHSNVGGGYDDQQISNITLAWMVAQVEPFLDINLEYVIEQDRQNDEYYHERRMKIRPWSFGRIYNASSGIYAVGGSTTRTPGTYFAVDPSGRETSRPLRDTNEYIHPSVRSRFVLGGPGIEDKGRYECEALRNWKLVIDPPEDGVKGAGVYWKLRSREKNVSTRILPESPLWEIEKKLLSRDRRTYDYIFNPPHESKRRSKKESTVESENRHRRHRSHGK